MGFVLVNLADPDERFVLDNDSITVGRSSDCHIAIDDAKLAPVHCWLKKSGDTYRLVDAGGAGGIRVNSQTVESAELSVGDWIGIGRATYRFESSTADIPTAAVPATPPAPTTSVPTPVSAPATPATPAATTPVTSESAPRERTASGRQRSPSGQYRTPSGRHRSVSGEYAATYRRIRPSAWIAAVVAVFVLCGGATAAAIGLRTIAKPSVEPIIIDNTDLSREADQLAIAAYRGIESSRTEIAAHDKQLNTMVTIRPDAEVGFRTVEVRTQDTQRQITTLHARLVQLQDAVTLSGERIAVVSRFFDGRPIPPSNPPDSSTPSGTNGNDATPPTQPDPTPPNGSNGNGNGPDTPQPGDPVKPPDNPDEPPDRPVDPGPVPRPELAPLVKPEQWPGSLAWPPDARAYGALQRQVNVLVQTNREWYATLAATDGVFRVRPMPATDARNRPLGPDPRLGDSALALLALLRSGDTVNRLALGQTMRQVETLTPSRAADVPTVETAALAFALLAYQATTERVTLTDDGPETASQALRGSLRQAAGRLASALIAGQQSDGGWGLTGATTWTNIESTRWAMQGLYAAAVMGVNVPWAPLEKGLKFLLDSQPRTGADGESPLIIHLSGTETKGRARGFGYDRSCPPTIRHTAQGVIGLAVALSRMPANAAPELRRQAAEALRDALIWLGANFRLGFEFYEFEALASAAQMTGVWSVGSRDVVAEISVHALELAKKSPRFGVAELDTPYVLLGLSRAFPTLPNLPFEPVRGPRPAGK